MVRQTTPPISAGLLWQTDRYFNSLTAYPAGDAAPIVDQFAQACLFAADSGRRLIDALAEQLDLAREKLDVVRSDSPAWKVLSHLVAQPVVNTRYLREDIGMSKPQAERAIKQLVELGILVPRSGKQRNVLWEHRGIPGVLDGYAAGLRRGRLGAVA